MANKRKPTWRKLLIYLNTRGEGVTIKRTTLHNRFTDVKTETVDRYVRHLKMAGHLEKETRKIVYVWDVPEKSLTISAAVNRGRFLW